LIKDVLNKAEFDQGRLEVVVAPVSIHIASVKALLNENIKVACQNVSQTGKGAFTGEISCDQLKDFDVQWTIIGHSERRSLYGETDAIVATKTAQAQETGLYSMICIGEQLEERENGTTNDVLKTQLSAFKDSVKDWSRVVIAYEPVWAIGTGKTASPEIAQETHAFIRSWVAQNCGEEIAANVRIQYGGSVNAKNAADLISQPDIDGFLVGGASLKPDFNEVIKAVNNVQGQA
jgi:triosephosphate isomerase